ncbi:MAG TPA: hypothetical protein VH417_14895 [Vicinamibacterales bacterium]
MVRKTLMFCGVALAGFVLSGVANAQENATIVMRNGERQAGELVDLGGVGFTLRVGGQDRQIPVNDVAAVEFQGGVASGAVQSKVNAGQSVVVLRSGEVVDGRLYDIGGTHPLRVTVDTPTGRRDYTSNDVAGIYYGGAGTSGAVATSGQVAVAGTNAGTFTVPANQAWTNTGIRVTRGEQIAFQGNGDIMVAQGASAGVGGSPITPGGRLPAPTTGVGALIGRVGNSAPFVIGSNTGAIPMPAAGVLQLGVNDDHFEDNTGNFTVAVQKIN